jgi:hypothetical protein
MEFLFMYAALYMLILAFLTSPVILDEKEDEVPYVVVYNVRDLIASQPQFATAPAFDLNGAISGNNPFSSSPNTTFTKPDPNDLIGLIESEVYPDEWGSSSTIRYWNGNLIVNAPAKVHAALR